MKVIKIIFVLGMFLFACKQKQINLSLKSSKIEITFDDKTLEPCKIKNQETGFVLAINPTGSFRIELDKLTGEKGVPKELVGKNASIVIDHSNCKLKSITDDTLPDGKKLLKKIVYENPEGEITVEYSLGKDDRFFQKQIHFKPSFTSAYLLRSLSAQQFAFSDTSGISLRTHLHGVCLTHFIENKESGVFFGVQDLRIRKGNPVDVSFSKSIDLQYVINMRLDAGSEYSSEKIYWGVFTLKGIKTPTIIGKQKSCDQTTTPYDYGAALAMQEMTQSLFKPVMNDAFLWIWNGWDAKWKPDEPFLDTTQLLKLKDVLGNFIATGGATWNGLVNEVDAIKSTDTIIPFSAELLRVNTEAKKKGIAMILWHPMLSIHPWISHFNYCKDRPDWLLQTDTTQPSRWDGDFNCPANREFMRWLLSLHVDVAKKTCSSGYGQDEGTGRTSTLVCLSENHDHLPGDASYTYWFERRKFIKELKNKLGENYIFTGYRPQQDMGIWDAWDDDILFSLSEMGIRDANYNRMYARARYFGHFVPNHMHQSMIDFNPGLCVDYEMLNVLPFSRFCFLIGKPYLPEYKDDIRKWVKWANDNKPYMLAQPVFIPDDTIAPGCERYFRIVDGKGYAFVTNTLKTEAKAIVPLDDLALLDHTKTYSLKTVCLAVKDKPKYQYDKSKYNTQTAKGKVEFLLPGESTILLEILPI